MGGTIGLRQKQLRRRIRGWLLVMLARKYIEVILKTTICRGSTIGLAKQYQRLRQEKPKDFADEAIPVDKILSYANK